MHGPATGATVVAVLALHDVVPFDLAVPCEVFGRTRTADGAAPYEVRVCGPAAEVDAGWFSVRPPRGLDGLAGASTIVVPGTNHPLTPTDPAVLDALRNAAAGGTRIASVCSGAFVLAEAGLLDGRRATTHWQGTDELARRHPLVDVDPAVLYVDDGQILTSAGAAAGLDLCLHLVRLDHGAAVAAAIARASVMALERSGGQAQFIVHEPPAPDGASLEPLLRWLDQHLDRPLDLGALADRAGLSTRSLSRRFREQTGTTPLQWLVRARVRRAQHLLETTAHPIERVAVEVGFGSATSFRDHFCRVAGTTPRAYRNAFRSPPIPTLST